MNSLWDELDSTENNEASQNIDASLWDELDSKEPEDVITQEPSISLDLPKADEQFGYEVPGTVQPDDVSTTKPIKVMLGLGTTESPVYMNEAEAKEAQDKAYEEASVRGDVYIDPVTGENKGIPFEPGLEDVSLEALPIGKLGLGASESKIYDDIGEDFLSDDGTTRGLQAAAKLIAHTKRTTPEEVLKSVEHLSPEDRTIALAMGTKDKKFINHIREAVGRDSILASRLQDEVVTRKDIIKALGQNKQELKEASKAWDDMLDVANSEPVAYPLGNIADDLEYINTLYGTQQGKASTVVNKLKLASEDGATIGLGEALDLRKGLNRLLRKAPKGTDEIKHLTNIKNTVDSFINNATKDKPELSKLIKDTTENYARVKNNVQLSSFVNKATSDSGVLDYGKLLETIDKAGLKSPEVDKAVEIAKLFNDKFKLDKHLSDIVVPKGSDMQKQQQLFLGTIIRWSLDHLTTYNRFFNRSRFKDIAIQKEIRKSIKESKSIWEFMDKVKANSKVPNDVKESLEKTLLDAKKSVLDAKKAVETPKLPYKPGINTTGDTIVVGDKVVPESDVPNIVSNLPEELKSTPVRGELAGKIRVQDSQWQMVRDAIKGTDATVDYIHKQYFTPKGVAKNRFEGILKNTRKKLKVDDANHNIKVIKNIITDEAKQLIKYIEKSEGVKLPTEEAEKIIKMKLDDMVKDCK